MKEPELLEEVIGSYGLQHRTKDNTQNIQSNINLKIIHIKSISKTIGFCDPSKLFGLFCLRETVMGKCLVPND